MRIVSLINDAQIIGRPLVTLEKRSPINPRYLRSIAANSLKAGLDPELGPHSSGDILVHWDLIPLT